MLLPSEEDPSQETRLSLQLTQWVSIPASGKLIQGLWKYNPGPLPLDTGPASEHPLAAPGGLRLPLCSRGEGSGPRVVPNAGTPTVPGLLLLLQQLRLWCLDLCPLPQGLLTSLRKASCPSRSQRDPFELSHRPALPPPEGCAGMAPRGAGGRGSLPGSKEAEGPGISGGQKEGEGGPFPGSSQGGSNHYAGKGLSLSLARTGMGAPQSRSALRGRGSWPASLRCGRGRAPGCWGGGGWQPASQEAERRSPVWHLPSGLPLRRERPHLFQVLKALLARLKR